jgi:DoxX-like family
MVTKREIRMKSTIESVSVSKGGRWAGSIVSAVVVLFMVFDGVTKVMKAQQVMEATARIGFPESTIVGIGAALLVCTALYVIPQTSVLGAILLTAYLGGATAANVRVGSPVFNTSFPIIFGVLVWLGLFLRESRLRALIPLRT